MLISSRLQIPNAVLFDDSDNARLIGDLAEMEDRNTVYPPRQAGDLRRSNREQQFEVLATVQCEHQRIKRAPATKCRHVLIKWNL